MIFKLNMENNVIQSGEIIRYRKFLGNKTLNLKRGVDFGFCVPEFVALPATISKRLFLDKKFRDQVVNEIIKNTQYKSYAVRSSALIEDGKNESLAGKFLTKINITKNKLEYAVYEVLKQAEARGDLKKFSVIIQKYILPNISGVTFTRDPKGGREMVVEYAYCTGEKIVGGETKPRRISFYWHDIFPKDLPEEFIANIIMPRLKFRKPPPDRQILLLIFYAPFIWKMVP